MSSNTTEEDTQKVSVTVEADEKPKFSFTFELDGNLTEEEANERALELARAEAPRALEETARDQEWVEPSEQTETSDSDTLFLDEEEELYGYGVYNTHKNCFVSELGHTTDPDVFTDPQQAVEHFKDINEPDKSHLRIVSVRLNNELDKEAAGIEESGKEQEEESKGVEE